ncbi:hypothetical protein CbC4_4108 (plasmid) [Clostridium botulinum BKT015925]|nr:hypothetical protein CbC4_4108 [Clostridium botulinum BKT015925]
MINIKLVLQKIKNPLYNKNNYIGDERWFISNGKHKYTQ